MSEKEYTLRKEFRVDLLLYVFYRAESCEAVYKKTAIDLADRMRCNFPAFSGNRLNLEQHVLKSLAEKEDFDDFITYITNPRRQTEAFIKAEVEKYIFRDQKDEAVNILKKNVDDIKTTVSQALFTATQKVQNQRGNTEMWLNDFSNVLKDELTIYNIFSENFSDIKDFHFLIEEIQKGFKSITEKMSSLSLDKLKESRLKPEEILIDQLCNCCWVKCPFCAAVCTNTMKAHSPDDHSTPFHRPDGINGYPYRKTKDLSVIFCTTLVRSEGGFYPSSEKAIPYKQYRIAGPPYDTWSITPDRSDLAYWKWFVCQFKTQLENHYGKKFQGSGAIPDLWKYISKEEAIRSLEEMF
uniref:Interferon-induced very large GTPase 1-like n=1 Tax=Neolamprologus brichardi TaxID=32507 RepID=A0A3Q4GTV9_NEOBR